MGLSADLFVDGRAVSVQRLEHGGVFSAERLERDLLWFHGQPGVSYRLVVNVERPTTKLEATGPEVRVSLVHADGMARIGWPIAGRSLLGAAVGGAGIMTLGWSLVEALRRRRASASGRS